MRHVERQAAASQAISYLNLAEVSIRRLISSRLRKMEEQSFCLAFFVVVVVEQTRRGPLGVDNGQGC